MHSLFGITFVLFLLKLSAGKGYYKYTYNKIHIAITKTITGIPSDKVRIKTGGLLDFSVLFLLFSRMDCTSVKKGKY